MSDLGISIDQRGIYLAVSLLVVLLPLTLFFSFRSLTGLGRWRRLFAIGLRVSLIVLMVAAFCEIKLERTSEKLTVIYLLDQSESIPAEKREAMLRYVQEEVRTHRQASRFDRAGIIVFGANAQIEIPPFDDDILINRLETLNNLRVDATSMEAALKLAKASFPEDSAKRVVIVTDGNENLGDAIALGRSLADDGVGVDCLPVTLEPGPEVWVEKVSIPTDIRKDQPFQPLVIVNNETEPRPGNPTGVVGGVVRLTQTSRQNERLVEERRVELRPGKNVIPFRDEIDRTAMFTYRAVFIPDNEDQDGRKENNEANAFTHVRGRGRVLLIEDWKTAGQFGTLVDRLRAANIEVDVMSTDRLFTRKEDLLEYDSVVLANVPRSSGDSAVEATSFSETQIEILVGNTENMGCGLVMIGGDQSFGAGGWANTDLEKAMPVDFQIRNKEVQAVGALVLLMHATEMAQGNYWQKVIGRQAVETLGPLDYCGLIEWDNFTSGGSWAWGEPDGLIQIGENKPAMLRAIDRMTPGDMQDFEPSMQRALLAFKNNSASVKHMIIISDGDPNAPMRNTMRGFIDGNIKISTVAVGTHGPAGSQRLQDIANATGGQYYVVTDPTQLPRIYQREARRVSRQLIKENPSGIRCLPQDLSGVTGITQGIDIGSLPPIYGYVQTTIKQSPLVEQLIIADQPDDGGENSTVLATWRFGLGKATAFTSDAGSAWASDWLNRDEYDKFFSQLIRDSMRPITEETEFIVASSYEDGQVRLVVTAIDENRELVNFLNMRAFFNRPDLSDVSVEFQQKSPGRYEAVVDADQPGSFTYMIDPGEGFAKPRGGVIVPFSSEYNERETNQSLLETLVQYSPIDGRTGQLIEGGLDEEGLPQLLATDTFRHDLPKAVSFRDLWIPLIFISACLFLADVFVRRVAIDFTWVGSGSLWMYRKIFGNRDSAQSEDRMERLRNQKAAVQRELSEKKASMRFEPASGASGTKLKDVVADVAGEPTRTAKNSEQKREKLEPESKDKDSYTSRLLEAKKRARKKGGSND